MSSAHWTESWIGRPYVEGDADCGMLACEVWRSVFGGRVPDVAVPDRAVTRLQRNRQIDAVLSESLFPVDVPQDGDVVLMKSAGRLEHVGVFVRIGRESFVLHAMRNAGRVVLHRLRDLAGIGLAVVSYHRWKP